MAPVIATTDADRPAAEVFTCATDPARFHEWQTGITEGCRSGKVRSPGGAAANRYQGSPGGT